MPAVHGCELSLHCVGVVAPMVLPIRLRHGVEKSLHYRGLQRSGVSDWIAALAIFHRINR